MTAYSNPDAARDLHHALDKAPAGAMSGKWFATTEQAGVSSQAGGYIDAEGIHVAAVDSNTSPAIRKVVEKLEASQTQPFNKVVVRWTRSKIPLVRSRVTVETIFDKAIVPRGP